jgi:hypothetical protein
MFHIIYQSKDIASFSGKELKKLLLRSRSRNGADGITGVLLFHEGTFLQALEGGEAAVKATFARIAQDSRHEEVCVLANVSRAERHRIFGEWSMGFANASETAKILNGFIGTHEMPNFSELDALTAMNLLRWSSERTGRISADALG